MNDGLWLLLGFYLGILFTFAWLLLIELLQKKEPQLIGWKLEKEVRE